MIVKEMIKQLQELDENLRIISPKDDEGNGYRWPDTVDIDAYVRTEQLGEWGLEDLYSKDCVMEKWNVYHDGEAGDPFEGYTQVVYIG